MAQSTQLKPKTNLEHGHLPSARRFIHLPTVIFLPHFSQGCVQPPHSEREWQLVLMACGWRCFYCAEILLVSEENARDRQPTKDHLIPVFRGGCDCCGNIVPSCTRCNSMKKESTVQEFLEARRAFVQTIRPFPTSITSLEEKMLPHNNPVLKAINRIAATKTMDVPRQTADTAKLQLRRRA